MVDTDNIEFDQVEWQPPSGGGPSRFTKPLIAVLLVLLVAAGGYWALFMRTGEPPKTVTAAKPAPTPAPVATGALCVATDAAPGVASLNNSDAAVAPLVRVLSTNPRVVAWLATPNLIRSFVVSVENISNNTMPITPLRALKPAGNFRTSEAREETRIDPRSYDRYNTVAAAVDSVNVPAAARLCASLKPRFEDAWKELGRDGTFDVALERAIVKLLETPSLGGDEVLVSKGALWAFENEELEMLAPAQRQLLRMGPRNERLVQEKLRQVALAIGIPAARLPAESIR